MTDKSIIKGHRKIQVGDTCYTPLDRNVEVLKNGRGSYIPNSKHQVALIQVIAINPQSGIQLAIYEGLYSQVEVYNLNIEQKLSSSKVAAIYETTSNSITRGWWPFLGNYKIPYDMPYQAYYRLDNVIVDYLNINEIAINKHKNIKFIRHGMSGTNGIITEIARGINGLETEWELDYNEFLPNPEAVVWKIFPEHYPEPKQD
jgi:hypothetical protein